MTATIVKLAPKLKATVTHKDGRTAKARVVTLTTIWLTSNNGEVAVAHKEMGGKFSEAQALAEFRRLPNGFTKHGGYPLYQDLLTAGLVK